MQTNGLNFSIVNPTSIHSPNSLDATGIQRLFHACSWPRRRPQA